MQLIDTCLLCGSQEREELFIPLGENWSSEIASELNPRQWLCKQCGLVYQSPRLDEQEISRLYPNGTSALADASQGELTKESLEHQKHQDMARREWLRRHYPPPVHDRYLAEIGCGAGLLLSLLREDGWSPLGIETDKSRADCAREQFGLEVIDGHFEPGKLPENTFDLVILSHVVGSVSDPVALLRSASRLLRSGGRLFIETPNLLMPYSCPEHFCPSYHLYTFSPTTLQDLLLRSGLSSIHIDVDSCWIKVLVEKTLEADEILLLYAKQQIKVCLGRLASKEFAIDEIVACLNQCCSDPERLQSAITAFAKEINESWEEFQSRHHSLLDNMKQEALSPAVLQQMFRGLFVSLTHIEKTLSMRDWAPGYLADLVRTASHFARQQAQETDINKRCQYEVQKYIQLRGILSKAIAETNQRLKQVQFRFKMSV